MTDLFIIGTGPAGISASLYAVRAGLSVTAAGKDAGALGKAEKIENYYGFSEPLTGMQLYENGIAGAERLGVNIINDEVFDIEYVFAEAPEEKNYFKISASNGTYTSLALVLAGGTGRKAPRISGLKEHEGRGVSYCAVCDAFFYRNQKVAVIGNGDYALNEALHLAPTSSEVVILTNGNDFVSEKFSVPAGQVNEIKVPAAGENLKFDSRRITEISGEPFVSSVTFEDGSTMDTAGVFIAMGTASASDFARKLGAADMDGKLMLDENMAAAVPGLFAAGDCTGGMLQVAKAVYDGALAGSSAVKYIRSLKK